MVDGYWEVALTKLQGREVWEVDLLPPSMTADVLTELDERGLIETRACWWDHDNETSARDDGCWWSMRRGRFKDITWTMIVNGHHSRTGPHEKQKWPPVILPHELRLTEKGRAELARIRESDPVSPLWDDGRRRDEAKRLAKHMAAVKAAYALASQSDLAGDPTNSESGRKALRDLGSMATGKRPDARTRPFTESPNDDSAKSHVPPTRRSRRERTLDWLSRAMLVVQDHPEWADSKIADQVGIDKSRLSRSRIYQTAARAARTSKTPAGSITVAGGGGKVEAEDDSFNPNRRASRQSVDEEDADDRIDREINERNAKRNGGR